MIRKIASTVCALGITLNLCAQDLGSIKLTNKEDSVAYAKTYLSIDEYQKSNPEEYENLIKHSNEFVSTIQTTYIGIIKGYNENQIREEIAKKKTDSDSKEVVETALLMSAMATGKDHKGAVVLRCLCDRISGDTTINWKTEDMALFYERANYQAQNMSRDKRWDNLIKNKGYVELAIKDEGVASGLEYEGRGVLMKSEKKGKGDKIGLKDKVNIAFSMYLSNGTEVCKSENAQVVPDNVINGLCAALLNMREGAKATIRIPEGLGYRDDIVFEDPLKANRDLVNNKGLKMVIEVLTVKSK
ncbi:MAG: FKBP-type peptidyl-prolyl cis-trans isomerase [Paludibacteraceae bacterium]|nr:FKBP-type peptidyl-prolyl cis-trans isomerase [Paludibacteraceae bacterium]